MKRSFLVLLIAFSALSLSVGSASAQEPAPVPTDPPTTTSPRPPAETPGLISPSIHGAGGSGQGSLGVHSSGSNGGGGSSPTGSGGNSDGTGTCVGIYCSPAIDDFAQVSCALGFSQWCREEDEPVEPVLPPAIDVAQMALDSVEFAIPEPQMSPPARQVTGLRTWFWMDPGAWHPVGAHAEVPGLWASVTVTPTTARWTPGDGGSTVTCQGPGRPHPGTDGARTDCGHVYTHLGDYTLAVAVTYTVTWTSSTGEGGTLDPITLTADLPVHVEERQAVTD